MHYRMLLFMGIFFLAATPRLFAQQNYEVRKITFVGNKTLKKDFLLDKMALQEVSWLEKTFTKKEPYLYSRELTDLYLERLKKIYQTEGFLNVEASLLPLIINEKKQTVKLVIGINEGEPITINRISLKINGETHKPDADSLLRKISGKLALKEGKRFRDEALEQDTRFTEDIFRSLGFAYSSSTYELNLNPQKLSTDVRYTVSPGPVSHIGKTQISGNQHVSDKFIQKQLKYEEGDLYDKSRLDKTRQNLYNLQLFRVVSVLPEREPETQKSPIPVKIYIEEAPRLSTRFGAGYGTEDKFRTFLDLNYRGFLGGARNLNLYLKHSALEPYSVRLRWAQPRFLGTNSNISVSPFLIRNKEPGYDTRTFGVNIPLGYQFTPSTTGKITYYLENVQQQLEQGDSEFSDMESDKFLYDKSGVLLSALFNNSKPAFSPASGVNFSLGYKINGYIFGSDFSYTQLWADFRTYQKLGSTVLAFRIMAGGISSADSSGFIPVEDRFYSGGANSIRGWNRAELGPKRESGTPLGGKSIFESNIEIRVPIVWRLSMVAFFETGNVWEKQYTYNFNQLGYAAGSGLRIETPIGPVRLDVGVPLWNEKKSAQLFISVGQAF
ncbi:outer membrane protein insertion porin family [Mariniphaga anaerophila]|uniref:Outer membrane protein insertion porin family n=1 Tax=Mariniphaga anaerophila TaxID=1484053 RepID=A0A1M4XU99_9BACT|nr:BamA/TamA family outer membrane protein [Mariniphaga anaerophila]SHE96843.1 outer membrane protein insertion porin family [Mariniphaga anaerophila]